MSTSARAAASALAVVLLSLTGCSDDTAPDASSSAPSASETAEGGVRLVALGDSGSTGAGDDEGTGWVQRYADLLEAATGQTIEVANRASEGLTSDVLAGQVESNGPLRDELAAADYIVLGAGGADLNAGDDAWAAGSCSGPPCYTDVLAGYEENIARIAAVVAELRSDRPTVLRAVTAPNVLTGAEAVIPPFLRATATETAVFLARSHRESTCAAVRAHGGECIDVLTAFNGPDGTRNAYTSGLLNLADCCYPSSRGQQRMAELLLATGFEPETLS